ncbi:MAG TPA: 50S ribosomal protein L18 [Candidatus Saccharimonadales bacterium]|nr:50S ribosomal protein L18 [Candidatus Saccharimonadales bacterium]
MEGLKAKKVKANRRALRVRARTHGTSGRPRLSVHVSNTHVTAQIIDDEKAKTLAYATTVGQKVSGNMTDKAVWVGEAIAKKARNAKVRRVVFDRGERKYHGRLKALADSARKAGLEF